MQIKEVAVDTAAAARLAALAKFLLSRSIDADSKKSISVDAFVKLADSIGVPVTKGQLIDLIDMPPLNSLISNIEGETISFGNQQDTADDVDTMSVDQARQTVDSMAKRAAKKTI